MVFVEQKQTMIVLPAAEKEPLKGVLVSGMARKMCAIFGEIGSW